MKTKLSAAVLSFVTIFFILTSLANARTSGTIYTRKPDPNTIQGPNSIDWSTDWTQEWPDLEIIDVQFDTDCDNGTALVDVTVTIKNTGGISNLPAEPIIYTEGSFIEFWVYYEYENIPINVMQWIAWSQNDINTTLGHNETAQLYLEFDIKNIWNNSEIWIVIKDNYSESNEDKNQILLPVPDEVYQCIDYKLIYQGRINSVLLFSRLQAF